MSGPQSVRSGWSLELLLAGVVPLVAVVVGGMVTYFVSRELQVGEGRDAARGTARVLQEELEMRAVSIENTGARVLADRRGRADRRILTRVAFDPIAIPWDDRKLIALNLDSSRWSAVSQAMLAYEAWRRTWDSWVSHPALFEAEGYERIGEAHDAIPLLRRGADALDELAED